MSEPTEAQECGNKYCPMNLYSQVKTGTNELCATCLDRYQKDFYCVYCHQIYFETTDDGKNWIECDKCKGWVHEDCADVSFAKGFQNSNLSFKCIKCKKVDGKQSTGVVSRRGAINRVASKGPKKVESGALFNIGFQWQLKQEQVAEDLLKMQEYLR